MTCIFTEKQVETKWLALLRKYRDEYKKVNIYHTSGSEAAVVVNSDWPLYLHMAFMESHIQHRPTISSNDKPFPSTSAEAASQQVNNNQPSTSSTSNSTVKKNRFERKRKSDDFGRLQLMIESNERASKSLAELNNKVSVNNDASDVTTVNTSLKKYILLIRKGFGKVSDNDKFDCCSAILQYVQHFKADNDTLH